MASSNGDRPTVLAPGVGALLAVENARLRSELCALSDELQRSRARLVASAARERRQLERELHDRAQNRIIGLQVRLQLVCERARESAPEIAALLAALVEQTARVCEELQRIARGIAPPLLATRGVVEALRGEAMLSGVRVTTYGRRVGLSTPEVELAVYLSCLEAIQNAAKHAGRGASVTVRLWRKGDELAFAVVDDGCGFDASSAPRGSGLAGIRDRIGAVGGWVEVTSAPGAGVRVAGAVPWPPRDS